MIFLKKSFKWSARNLAQQSSSGLLRICTAGQTEQGLLPWSTDFKQPASRMSQRTSVLDSSPPREPRNLDGERIGRKTNTSKPRVFHYALEIKNPQSSQLYKTLPTPASTTLPPYLLRNEAAPQSHTWPEGDPDTHQVLAIIAIPQITENWCQYHVATNKNCQERKLVKRT